MTWPAQAGMRSLALWYALPALLLLVAVGVVGDMVGIAAAAADPAALHAMASRRLPGARIALALKRNAAQVTSICGDIVGDVAGTVSGAAAAAVAARLAGTVVAGDLAASLSGAAGGAAGAQPPWLAPAAEAGAVAIIAALTVGGKAFAKGIALERANDILYWIGRFLDACQRLLPGRRVAQGRGVDARDGRRDARAGGEERGRRRDRDGLQGQNGRDRRDRRREHAVRPPAGGRSPMGERRPP